MGSLCIYIYLFSSHTPSVNKKLCLLTIGMGHNPDSPALQIDEYDSFHKRYPNIPMLGTETTSTFGVRGCYATDKDTHQIASYDDDPSDWALG